MRRTMLIAALLLLGLAAFIVWRGSEPGGIDDVYTAAFGPADLGPVTFETLTRSPRPNDALVCPRDFCRAASPDLEAPVFPVPGERLRQIAAEVAQREADLVYSARWEEQDRFVARTRFLRFPDTVSIRVIGQGEGRSTLAIYSRSQIGYSDLGVNRKRVERWLRAIEERVARETRSPAQP